MARISYINPDDLEDPELRDALHQAMLRSTPRPEIQAVRAQQPEVLRAFIYTWDRLFKGGIVDRHIKELCRLRVSQTLGCDY
ncbi:MAG TPA: carboxymuconolactone decarboxylase family protein [Burkholderiales bacterium]|nr:carboxymuconolactone decarboxylase family protein [Burkholderiales bacterium]